MNMFSMLLPWLAHLLVYAALLDQICITLVFNSSGTYLFRRMEYAGVEWN